MITTKMQKAAALSATAAIAAALALALSTIVLPASRAFASGGASGTYDVYQSEDWAEGDASAMSMYKKALAYIDSLAQADTVRVSTNDKAKCVTVAYKPATDSLCKKLPAAFKNKAKRLGVTFESNVILAGTASDAGMSIASFVMSPKAKTARTKTYATSLVGGRTITLSATHEAHGRAYSKATWKHLGTKRWADGDSKFWVQSASSELGSVSVPVGYTLKLRLVR